MEDEWGSFEAAALPSLPQQQPAGWAPAPLAGVKALQGPLPLELFGDDAVSAPKPAANSAAARDYAKGELVWYQQRDSTWAATQVVSVDHTVSPPSYGVHVAGVYRETEWYRLQPRSHGQTAPPPGQPAAAAAAPGGPAVGTGPPAVPAPTPSALPAQPLQQQPSAPPPPPPQQQQQQPWGAHVANGVGHAAAAQELHQAGAAFDEDDFGDFAAAPAPVAPAAAPIAAPYQQPVAVRAPTWQAPVAVSALSKQPLAQEPARPPMPPAPSAAAASSSGMWQRWHQRQQQQHTQHGTLRAHSQPPSPDRLKRRAQQAEGLFHSHSLPTTPARRAQQAQQAADLLDFEAAAPRQPAQQQQGASSHPAAASVPAGACAEAPSPLASPAQSSPALQSFHSFLRAAAPQAARRLESWGEYEGAAEGRDGSLPAAAAAPASPAGPQLGRGVDRAAPLPVDIFGEEMAPVEDAPLPSLSPASPTRAAGPLAGSLAGTAPSGMGQPPGAAHLLSRGASAPAAAAGTAAAAAVPLAATGAAGAQAQPPGSGWSDDDFGDFAAASESQPPAGPTHGPGSPSLTPASAPAPPAALSSGKPASLALPAAPATGSAGSWAGSSCPASPVSQSSLAGSAHGSQHGAAAEAVPAQAPAAAAGHGGAAAAAVVLDAVSPHGQQQQRRQQQQPYAGSPEPAAVPGTAWPLAGAEPAAAEGSKPASAAGSPTASAAALPLEPPWPAHVAAGAGPVATGAGGGAGLDEAVTEYAVAWAKLLQAAAQQLELGGRLWQEACANGSAAALLEHPGAQRYLAALGQIYCAALAVQVGARLLGLFGLVVELQEAGSRCQAVWEAPAQQQQQQQQQHNEEEAERGESGGSEGSPGCAAALNFREAMLLAAASYAAAAEAAAEAEPATAHRCPAPLETLLQQLGKLEGAAATLPPDVFPRVLEWSEGLDGITLLPLCLLGGAPAAPPAWLGGRPCLAAVANLWAGCVSRTPPRLD